VVTGIPEAPSTCSTSNRLETVTGLGFILVRHQPTDINDLLHPCSNSLAKIIGNQQITVLKIPLMQNSSILINALINLADDNSLPLIKQQRQLRELAH